MEGQQWIQEVQKRPSILDVRLKAILAASEGREPVPFEKIRLPSKAYNEKKSSKPTSVKNSLDSLKVWKKLEQQAEQEQLVADEITKNMLRMTARLKENAYVTREIIRADNARLDIMENNVIESNHTLTQENRALKTSLRRTFKFSCTTWISLGLVCISFLWMILFMKII